MLQAITMSTAVAYEAFIENMDRLYKGCWHLIVQADELARSEHMLRLKVSTEMDISMGGKVPAMWNVDNPWEALFRRLLKDSDFWAEQVHLPANAWLAHGSKGKLLTPSEAIAESSIQGGSAVLKPDVEGTKNTQEPWKRSANARRREAKKRKWQEAEEKNTGTKGKGKGKGKGKVPACYAWNNNNGACAGLPPGSACRGNVAREHRCTACGSPGHPSHQCSQKES
jgi:hypothetical protein